MTATPAREALDWVLSITTAPSAEEIAGRFSEPFLAAVPAEQLCQVLPAMAAGQRDQLDSLEVIQHGPHAVVATIGDVEIQLSVTGAPPHQVNGLLFKPREATVEDPRLDDAPASSTGPLDLHPEQVLREAGLVGLRLHVQDGASASGGVAGWADLEAGRALSASDVFPAYSVTKLLTTVVVLQLVGEGVLELAAPVAQALTSLTVPEEVTVRHLLTHHGGLSNAFSHWEDEVPDQVALLGPVVEVDRTAGETYSYSNAGFGVLGQLIADVTGKSYPAAVAERVLEPLGMRSSGFPVRVAGAGVALHDIGPGGVVVPSPQKISTVPAAGGLWSTADDLGVFGRDWAGLLPPELAAEATRPQEKRSETSWVGYGWLLSDWGGRRLIGHAGGGIGASSSLLALPDEELVAITLTNRSTSVEPLTVASLQKALAARG